MKVTYPLDFALSLSPVNGAFHWTEETDLEVYHEVDTKNQAIRKSFYTDHTICKMDGEPHEAYVKVLQEEGISVDEGWLPFMSMPAYW